MHSVENGGSFKKSTHDDFVTIFTDHADLKKKNSRTGDPRVLASNWVFIEKYVQEEGLPLREQLYVAGANLMHTISRRETISIDVWGNLVLFLDYNSDNRCPPWRSCNSPT